MNHERSGKGIGASRGWQAVLPWMFGVTLLGAALLLAYLGEAWADDNAGVRVTQDLEAMEEADHGGRRDAGKSAFSATSQGSYVAPVAVSKARMAAWREAVTLSYDTGRLGLDMGYTGTWYDFSRVGRLPFGGRAPFEALHALEAGLTVRGDLWRAVKGFVGLRGNLGFERDPVGAPAGSILAGASFPLGDHWLLTLGGGVSVSKITTQAFPVASVRYASPAMPDLSVELGFPRTEVAWRGGKWWGLRVTGAMDGGEYKLAEDNPVAGGGFVSLLEARVGTWLDLWPYQGLSVSLGALYALPGTMTFYRESGSRIKEYDTGGGPGGAARLRFTF